MAIGGKRRGGFGGLELVLRELRGGGRRIKKGINGGRGGENR